MAIIRNTMEDIKRYIGSNEQTDAVFPPGNAHSDFVAFLDHVVIVHGTADITQ